jgi:hypothetical protein
MIYALVQVIDQPTADTVRGYWLQDHIGTRQTATARAARLIEVNGDRIVVALCLPSASVRPIMDGLTTYKRA